MTEFFDFMAYGCLFLVILMVIEYLGGSYATK